MPDVLQEVLKAVKEGFRTASDIWEHRPMECDKTAINNRLERLRRYGYLSRKRGPGRAFIYTETPKKRKHRHG